MRNSILFAAVLAGLGTLAGTANAADNGFYLGASVGRSNVDIKEGPVRLDDNDTGYKLIAGFRPLDWLGVELNYVDFGKTKNATYQAEGDAISAFAVGFLPVGPVDLYAKAGLVNSDTKVKVRGLGDALKSDGTDPAYGVGVQFRLLSLSVRAEYEVFDVDHVDDLNLFSIGATYTFL